MPHLSEMQARHADDGVTIIGIAKEDSNGCTAESIRKMTKDKGDTMAYTVAIDDDGKTYTDYMKAAGQRGIPASFLVDRKGKIAFIGHPAVMDVPMAMVANGTWDYVEGPKQIEAMRAAQNEIFSGARRADKNGAKALLVKLDTLKADFPSMAEGLLQTEYNLLITAEYFEKASIVGRSIVDAAIEDKNSQGLNAIAWGIVDPEADLASRDLGLALYAATMASNFTDNSDPAILDTLARAHFMMGGIDRAIEIQTKAIAIGKENGTDSRMMAGIEASLEEYMAAKAK